MDTEYLAVDEGGESEIIEDFGAATPYVERAEFSVAFFIEAIGLRDASGLVISTNEGDPGRVFDFQPQQIEEGFDGVLSAVHVVAQKNVVDFREVSSDAEEFEQVFELSVDVAADCHWGS